MKSAYISVRPYPWNILFSFSKVVGCPSLCWNPLISLTGMKTRPWGPRPRRLIFSPSRDRDRDLLTLCRDRDETFQFWSETRLRPRRWEAYRNAKNANVVFDSWCKEKFSVYGALSPDLWPGALSMDPARGTVLPQTPKYPPNSYSP